MIVITIAYIANPIGVTNRLIGILQIAKMLKYSNSLAAAVNTYKANVFQ